jgi:FKBP-type peptidyl-prolyl cis-trans isomerase 2
MAQAKNGDLVKVHYTGKLTDGSIFDSSANRDPMEFTLGQGQLISGFENAVRGMEEGQSTTVTIPSAEAYGSHDQNLIYEVDKAKLPDTLEPEVGQKLESVQQDGQRVLVEVINISDNSVTIDANHPLAGKDLIFDIELTKIL